MIEQTSRAETTQVLLALAVLVSGLAAAVLSDSRMLGLATIGLTSLVLATYSIELLEQVLVALVILELPLQVDVYVGHDPAVAATNALSGFNVSALTGVLVVLLAVWAARRAAGADDPLAPDVLSRSTWLFVALLGLSAVWALEPTRALHEAWLVGQAALLFAYLRHHLRTTAHIERLHGLLLVALLLEGVIVIATYANGGALDLGVVQSTIVGERGGGTFGSPNVLGSFVTLLLPLGLVALRRTSPATTKALAWAAIAAGGTALVLSNSRGAWIGSAAATILVLGVGVVRGWFSGRTLVGMAGLAAGAGLVFADRIADRVAAFDNAAAQARAPLNRLALQVIGGDPVVGVGANNFSAAMRDHLDVSFGDAWISTVHNKYLLVWAETGVIGLVLFLVFVGSVIALGARHLRSGDRLAPIAVAVGAAFVGTSLHMLVELFHARAQYQLIWTLAALAAGVAAVSSGRRGHRYERQRRETVD